VRNHAQAAQGWQVDVGLQAFLEPRYFCPAGPPTRGAMGRFLAGCTDVRTGVESLGRPAKKKARIDSTTQLR
jgi:hypothetical protein